MKPSNYLENKTPSATYWRVQLVCKKVQDHGSLEPPVQYNQEKCFEQKVCDKQKMWRRRGYLIWNGPVDIKLKLLILTCMLTLN